jgi:Domain of Unknown Function with PDB structure (DUF3857)/Transglutaminase-like superfamily
VWRQTKRVVILLALALGQLRRAAAGVNIPEWVRQAAAQPVGTYSPETKLVVLLDQTDYTVVGSGEFIEHSRNVVKILRPDGREARELGVTLEGKDKLHSVHAWTIDKDGREYEVKDKEFIEASGYPDWLLYADDRSMVAKAPSSIVGSVIAFEYEVRRHRWINELGWIFQDRYPVLQALLSLQLPTGWEYRASWTHGTGIEPVAAGNNRWQWTLKNIPGIEEERETRMPPFLSLAGRMSISYFGPGDDAAHAATWPEVGRWYAALAQGRSQTTPEIATKVRGLIAGKSDFASRLQTVVSFVQSEIRYVAIEIGIGGNQPHPAADVFRYRYGDCKDKVTLLKAMLQEAGIASYYVLLDTRRGFINPSIPSSWGNHAVIAIELPSDVNSAPYLSQVMTKTGKRYIIFDPTDEYTPVGSLRADLQDSYALLVTDNSGELIRTPLLPPDWNQIIRKGHFVLSAEGNLAGEVTEDRSGDSATYERARLHYTDERRRTADFEHWLGRSVQGFTLDKVNIEQADQLTKDLLMNYKFTAPQYAQLRGPLMLVRPRVLDEKSAYVERKPRHYPIELEHTIRQTDVYEIELPKEYAVDDVPNSTKIDVGFATYQSKIETDGSKLRYWREYVVRDLSVPPEKYNEWVRLQGAIGTDEAATVVLKRLQ